MNMEAETQKRILIVDDDAVYAAQVKNWLLEKYHVDVVSSGSQALRFLSMKKVDLILLDYEMPEMDGAEVLEQLRSDPEMKGLQVVFLTGTEEKEELGRMMGLRPNGYLLKIATKERIMSFVKQQLE